MKTASTRMLGGTGRSVALVAFFSALSCGGESNGNASKGLQGPADSGAGGAQSLGGAGGKLGGTGGEVILSGTGGDLGIPGAGGSVGVTPDAGPPHVDAGPEPVVACGNSVDASAGSLDAAPCAPPPSHCADDRVLVYYTDGRCIDDACHWTAQFLTCPASCIGDGCRNNFTLTR